MSVWDVIRTIFVIVACTFWGLVLLFVLPSRKRRDWLATWSVHHGGVGEGPAFLPEEQEPTERQKLFGLLFFLAFFAAFTAFLVYGFFIDV